MRSILVRLSLLLTVGYLYGQKEIAQYIFFGMDRERISEESFLQNAGIDRYRDAIMQNMRVLREAFPGSTVIQYANFMPGEWLPWDDKGYLEDLFKLAVEENVGMGGPDIKIWKRAQMNHSYKFLKMYADSIVTGIAVQDGNLEEINPRSGKKVTVSEIYEFGHTYLGLDYIFWCTQEPFYSSDVLPFLRTSVHEP